MLNPATLQPYTSMHRPTECVDSRRVPHAADRLLLPPQPASDESRYARQAIMDRLYPIHDDRCYPEDN